MQKYDGIKGLDGPKAHILIKIEVEDLYIRWIVHYWAYPNIEECDTPTFG